MRGVVVSSPRPKRRRTCRRLVLAAVAQTSVRRSVGAVSAFVVPVPVPSRRCSPPHLLPVAPPLRAVPSPLLSLSLHGGHLPPPPLPPPPPHHYSPGVRPMTTAVMGKLWPALSKVLHLFSPAKLRGAASTLRHTVQPQDYLFVGLLLLVAFARWDGGGGAASTNGDGEEARAKRLSRLMSRAHAHSQPVRTALRNLWLRNSVRSLARVALSAYAVDLACLVLRLQGGFHFPHLWDIPRVYAKASFSIWLLRRVLEWKRPLVVKYVGRNGQSGRADLVDKTLNGVSVALVALLVSDWLSVEMGLALKGAFALGSFWTLAFTLASKDLVSQLVSGLFLQATNKMTRGEKVQFGEGSTGKVVKIGWTETVLRGSDNTITSIPNAKLVNDKVVNYSRVPISQVQQVLRFHYRDIDVLPDVLESIRHEIKASCPHLVTDGSRPFRVFFTDYGEHSLQVLVDAHFRISPTSDEYWSNRQEVLLAIHRAVKRHRIPYAYDIEEEEHEYYDPRPALRDDGYDNEAAAAAAGLRAAWLRAASSTARATNPT